MRVNADFNDRVLVRFDETDWVASPVPGVERKMLDRIGEEVARATSIVRFAPGSAFSPHTHDGGEEYLVLDGTFQDEDGDFPAGSYVRNPPTSSHRPAARDGATILVKLHQFALFDRTQVQIDSGTAEWQAVVTGVDALPLHADARETVIMERWSPGTARTLDASRGLEIFVIDGALTENGDTLGKWDWLRLPVGSQFQAEAGPEGARVWIKTGHLRHVTARAA
ncbi:cupin domain-containing protein [Jannaschia seohaensis]|uniref:Anti-sigma factor ChrR (Cupin superfamily) n=1 Tax=Jannaschia seohaensis TaxID=475081 RepID=A0A2Y9ADL4_9RHOB|nr:cupin domain-containing protein [Jannaschia seohaensis]PWJ20928.1 anti-sigma factor ChrR (cupin superfamily) [Jannaschia seohaensis]SSA41338.1 Anti-sigma factor ChrR, cupin superfamily [Jannaschia seohaensis]